MASIPGGEDSKCALQFQQVTLGLGAAWRSQPPKSPAGGKTGCRWRRKPAAGTPAVGTPAAGPSRTASMPKY